ncbi:YlxR family protein [Actinophytocola gossypii]|uniref:YlxR family protein n=1 Tax=Actinophytocola gossypii TaxID=2812003 RepID=A0ABT2JA70_9PSEU|nr:YlxR family protein [Actinophytocola gossypii]MCT2584658.1 YlxR family protein [Actinophytocola gossypii]
MVHRSGPASARPEGSSPVRTCVGCRARAEAGELLRVALVDGELAPDPRRRASGRGAWLHPRPSCLDKAERRRAFARALRVPGPLDTGSLRSHLEQSDHRVTGSGSSRAGIEQRKQVDPS